jgi:hypothetical protein
MAVGDVVGTLSTQAAGVSYELTVNPGGFFAISGSNLIEAVDTPNGRYPITIRAFSTGFEAITSFSLNFTNQTPSSGLSDPVPIIF